MKALIFDFDGVIVDTEPVHYAAFQRVLKPRGLDFTWDDYVDFYIGFDDREVYRERFKKAGQLISDTHVKELVEEKARAFQKAVRADPPAPYDGVVDLIRRASQKLPVALCSGALLSDIDPVLDQLGIREHFRVIVTADDVPASKPDPACYRLTVQRLGLAAPSDGTAIEDTPAGIHAAKGAGLRVIAVTNSHPADKLATADQIVNSATEIVSLILSTIHCPLLTS